MIFAESAVTCAGLETSSERLLQGREAWPWTTAWRVKHKLLEIMTRREDGRILEGRMKIDDTCLGGEKPGMRAGEQDFLHCRQSGRSDAHEDRIETDMPIIIGPAGGYSAPHSSIFPVDHPMAHHIIHDNRIKPGIGHVIAFQTPACGTPASPQAITQPIAFHA